MRYHALQGLRRVRQLRRVTHYPFSVLFHCVTSLSLHWQTSPYPLASDHYLGFSITRMKGLMT